MSVDQRTCACVSPDAYECLAIRYGFDDEDDDDDAHCECACHEQECDPAEFL